MFNLGKRFRLCFSSTCTKQQQFYLLVSTGREFIYTQIPKQRNQTSFMLLPSQKQQKKATKT